LIAGAFSSIKVDADFSFFYRPTRESASMATNSNVHDDSQAPSECRDYIARRRQLANLADRFPHGVDEPERSLMLFARIIIEKAAHHDARGYELALETDKLRRELSKTLRNQHRRDGSEIGKFGRLVCIYVALCGAGEATTVASGGAEVVATVEYCI